ncbi:MAG: hypothetical protein WCK89_19420 [bacterium]
MLLDGRADASRQISVPHDPVTSTTEIALDLHTQLPKAKTPHEQESIQRQIATTDRQIDNLVYPHERERRGYPGRIV